MQRKEEAWPSEVRGLTGEVEHIPPKKVILREMRF